MPERSAVATKNEVPVPPSSFPADFPFIPIGHPDTMMSKQSVRRAVEEFKVLPTDIIVATSSKTGTTLVTWLCHLLRVIAKEGADYDFESHFQSLDTLYQVVPWPLLSWDIGYDPNSPSQFEPRVFKSHLRMASVYRGGKYIVTIRDPAKTALSFYNFFLAKKVPLALDMDVSTFLVDTPFLKGRPGRASLWEFYQEYHLLRDCPCVLVIVYEDLVQNMPHNMHRIARFMDLDITTDMISKVSSMSSKEYMAKHNTLFDEPYERAKQLGRAADLSQLAPGDKVATKTHTQALNRQAQQFLADQWKETMEPLGYNSYADFAASFLTS